MLWSMVGSVLSLLFDLASSTRKSDQAKDLEILILRHRLRILQRTLPHRQRPSGWEKLILAVLAARLQELGRCASSHWRRSALLFKPETMLRWHRELVRRKWTF